MGFGKLAVGCCGNPDDPDEPDGPDPPGGPLICKFYHDNWTPDEASYTDSFDGPTVDSGWLVEDIDTGKDPWVITDGQFSMEDLTPVPRFTNVNGHYRWYTADFSISPTLTQQVTLTGWDGFYHIGSYRHMGISMNSFSPAAPGELSFGASLDAHVIFEGSTAVARGYLAGGTFIQQTPVLGDVLKIQVTKDNESTLTIKFYVNGSLINEKSQFAIGDIVCRGKHTIFGSFTPSARQFPKFLRFDDYSFIAS